MSVSLPIGESIGLSKSDVEFCEHYGRLRQSQNEGARVVDVKYTDRDPGEIHVQGVRGELALALMLEMGDEVRKEIENAHVRGSKTDVGKDLQYMGKTVDVKCAKGGAPHGLLVTAKKRGNPADLYALVIDKGETLEFAGAMAGTDVFQHSRLVLMWGKEYYSVPLGDLKPMDETLGSPSQRDRGYLSRAVFVALSPCAAEQVLAATAGQGLPADSALVRTAYMKLFPATSTVRVHQHVQGPPMIRVGMWEFENLEDVHVSGVVVEANANGALVALLGHLPKQTLLTMENLRFQGGVGTYETGFLCSITPAKPVWRVTDEESEEALALTWDPSGSAMSLFESLSETDVVCIREASGVVRFLGAVHQAKSAARWNFGSAPPEHVYA